MRALAPLLRFFILCVSLTVAAVASAANDPDKDPQMPALLQDARKLIDTKKLGPAVEQCDKVIAAFKAYYEGRKQKIYCAGSSTESLYYVLNDAKGKDSTISLTADLKVPADSKDTIMLSPTWARACYMKGYALEELGQFAEAKSALQRAVELSPANCQYLSELGEIFKHEKNWPQALELYQRTEDSAGIASEESKTSDLGRARRGLGYVLVEQGKLAEAEQKYRQCLKDDPNDARAKRELEYVRSLLAKQPAH